MTSSESNAVVGHEEDRVMILMRGLPACGKSHRSRRLAGTDGVVLEFDAFFYTQVGSDPERYEWSIDRMDDARAWNRERICAAVDCGTSPLVVDSDNTAGPYTGSYVTYAAERGYRVEFAEPDSPWWGAIRPLLDEKYRNREALQRWAQKLCTMSKATHRVPLADLLRRIERWEETSVDGLLAAA